HTGLAMAAGAPKFKEKFRPAPRGFRQAVFNRMDALEAVVSGSTAAVILETIPATLGIVTPSKSYLKQVRELCDARGALLILDEIQTGFGRTGRLWGFEQYDVAPDMVTLGKGMSGGIYPISATVHHEKFAGFFKEDPFIHISTFGGSEIGCYAAMETTRISREADFLENVVNMGRFFKERLHGLAGKYPALGLKTRGLGLMMGLEFKDDTTALFLIKLFFDNGLYVVYAGFDPRVIQFLPPLIINEAEAERVMEKIETAFSAMSG
ncbi:MAG: aspartate aminotransferase family protein, partial [Desulfobacterales bacterium]|nr:aspartate aminotransferase family protein [Desulfobacterales bacterium]